MLSLYVGWLPQYGPGRCALSSAGADLVSGRIDLSWLFVLMRAVLQLVGTVHSAMGRTPFTGSLTSAWDLDPGRLGFRGFP